MTYTGETNEEGGRHGQGIYEFANGDRYEGRYMDDKRHGQGVLEFANGDRYEGRYMDDKRRG